MESGNPYNPDIVALIEENLKVYNKISFVLLFGSTAKGKNTPVSDVDLGIYFITEPSLIEIGAITNNLERAIKRPVDIVGLNELYKSKPEFSYYIVKDGVLVMCIDKVSFTTFKRESILAYLDVRPMREKVKKALMKRIQESKAGSRNYAGTT